MRGVTSRWIGFTGQSLDRYQRNITAERLYADVYLLETATHTSGPITAIHVDREQGTMWGGASDYGDDYGVAW